MVDISVLLKFNDFRGLGDVALVNIAEHAHIRELKRKQNLDAREYQGEHLYLVAGEVQVTANDRMLQMVREKTERSASEIFRVNSPGMYLECIADVKLLCVDREVMAKYFVRQLNDEHQGINVKELSSDEIAGSDNPVLAEIKERFLNREIKLPSLPDIVSRINSFIQDGDADIRQLAKIIQTDPVITARIINVANSALFTSTGKVDSVKESLIRIGIKATRGIVISVILRNLFRPTQPLITERSSLYYRKSIETGVLASMLSTQLKVLESDYAFLSGILHNIGILPVLIAADSHGTTLRDPSLLEKLINDLYIPVGVMLLSEWEFDDDIIRVIKEVEILQRPEIDTPDYCDLVQMAILHNKMLHKEPLHTKLRELPAFRRLGMDSMNPSQVITIMKDSSREIDELVQILNHDYQLDFAKII